jgi:hypothetical protein
MEMVPEEEVLQIQRLVPEEEAQGLAMEAKVMEEDNPVPVVVLSIQQMAPQ